MEKIVGLHGFWGRASDWRVLANVEGWDLYQYSHLSLKNAAAELAKKLSPESIVIGYSMGGRLALHLLEQKPVKAMIFLSTHPGLLKGHSDRIKSDKIWAEKFLSESWERLHQDWNQQPALSKSLPEQKSENEFSRKKLADCLLNWSLGLQQNFSETLASCQTPILWITGEKDSKFCALARPLENVEKIVIPNSGHRILLDAPEVLNKEVNQWLNRL